MRRSRAYLILQSAVCVILTGLMAASVLSIYREGAARKALDPLESVYTPEIVAERFAPVAPLFFASLGLLVAGLLLGVKDENAERPVTDAFVVRDLTVARIRRPSEAMLKEQARQRRLSRIGWGVFAVCMIPIALFLADPTHFPSGDPEAMFHELLRVFLPWTAAGLGALAVTAALRERSAVCETEAAKARAREELSEGAVPESATPPRRKGINAIRMAIIAAAVALIVAGIFNGSARDVLYKAITICTECVGLG